MQVPAQEVRGRSEVEVGGRRDVDLLVTVVQVEVRNRGGAPDVEGVGASTEIDVQDLDAVVVDALDTRLDVGPGDLHDGGGGAAHSRHERDRSVELIARDVHDVEHVAECGGAVLRGAEQVDLVRKRKGDARGRIAGDGRVAVLGRSAVL